ncbi:hypothetical protein [Oceanivirga salmonicida]|uniref:hypothetical protein n=1 Tax=Oceanivirga salmonicida TaxID=1769291 RepID=UPI00082D85EC|nr:hypothetical protein [Oceanivirga salmonicida]
MKKILMTILMIITLISCGKKGIVLLNNDGSVNSEYVDSTYSEIEKVSLEKIKEEGQISVKKALESLSKLKIDDKDLGFKLDFNELNPDISNLANIFLDSYKYELKSISYLSENEVDIEYLVKMPNIFSLEKLSKDGKFMDKIGKRAFDKINNFTLENVNTPNKEQLMINFILKEVAPDLVKGVIKQLEKTKDYVELTSFVSLKKINDKWELLNSDQKSDSKYAVLINKELKIESMYIEKEKPIIEKLAITNKDEISKEMDILKGIYSKEIIDVIELFQKNFDEEIKAIYFINTDKVFVKKEVKTFDIYSSITEFMQLIIDNKNLALENNTNKIVDEAKKIIENKIKENRYMYFKSYVILEKKGDNWEIIPSIDTEKILGSKFN